MKITVDATSALLRSAGVKSYTYHWVRALRAAARSDEIHGYPFLDDFGALDHQSSSLSSIGTYARLGVLYLTRDSSLLDFALRGADIFHASNQVRRAPKRAKLTATIHDLTCWLMPEFHTAGNIQADKNFAERILKQADGLIAVSENTRQDAIRLLSIAPDRIHTIHSGVAAEYFDAKPIPRSKPYVLCVGTIEPRKNLDVLLDTWELVSADLRATFDLVIAGPEGWGSEKTLARIRSEATYLGYVPEADLPGLTAGASVFVYPSLYEGFGFPVAQAMAANVATITSNNSSLREIAGDGAALLIDPKSPAEIANALARLLESESSRREVAARGRARANQYRWEFCALQSLQFFRDVNTLRP
jgi:glycosyltransferase involved in cell wall biosynthesis